jgi:hypothetical protein
MQKLSPTFATKFAITASVAALICATPVSLDLVQAGAAGADGTARLALTLDSAQAREAHGAAHAGRGADARGRNVAGNGVKSDNIKGNNVRANNVKANDVRANDIKANDARRNNVNVNNVRATNVNKTNVNAANVNAANVNAGYVRPPYLGRPAVVATTATAAAVGTAVTVLPASCTIVVTDGVTYHNCGGTYYIAADGAYVVVNPPR